MASLAEIIRTHHTEILELWTRGAQQVAAARGLDRPEFQNVIPAYLLALADAEDLGRFHGPQREQVESHVSARLLQGFQLPEIVEEFALLARCVAAMWNSNRGVEPPSHTEVENLFEELHLASAAVTEMFTRHMMDDEQAEKRFLRLIQDVASAALKADGPALEKRLKEVLALVMEAMGAQSAALLLFNPVTRNLDIKSSVGAADEEFEQYVSSLDASSFPGKVAAHEETTSVWDAAVSELTVSDALRRSGIHSLLGVRLPPRHRLLGVLYVGVTEKRSFTAREIHRLEALGHHLTIHLDNARLYADLRQHIDELDSERELRERFVSILAHDLRGPLSAAKMGAQLLIGHPERLDERRELAVKIDRNIERTDRMIRDLLDANRIRAGERLPLRIDECDLGIVAREVFEELDATFVERFSLEVEDRVIGFWSSEELRRALWNLATNAVKYGASDKPITIRVKKTAHGAEASVHNWGRPISRDERNELFLPFSRTHWAKVGGQKGWGLGLTLVQGCADAHGGRVVVESTEEAGTTFTITLPPDARPFQAGPRPASEFPAPPALH
jgi:signal transduction histidine kinase